MEENRLLDVKDLKVSFFTPSGEVKAVGGVSYHVDREEVIAIVGESGCGKSVTQMSVMQMIPDPPGKILGGEVWFEGKNLLKYKSKSKDMRSVRGAQISMIFQEPMTALNPVFTVGNQLSEVIRTHMKVSKKEAWKIGIQSLEAVGIPDPEERMKNYPFEMSGGMRQRVLIAIAVACRSKLIIADEPTTALDVTIQAQILTMICDLQRKYETSVIMITHDLGVVAETCDKVAIVYAGEIVEYGTLSDIFNGGRHHPYTEGLFGSIPSLTEETKRLHPIEGILPDPTNLPKGCKFSPRCTKCMEPCSLTAPAVYEENGHLIRCHLYRDNKGGQE